MSTIFTNIPKVTKTPSPKKATATKTAPAKKVATKAAVKPTAAKTTPVKKTVAKASPKGKKQPTPTNSQKGIHHITLRHITFVTSHYATLNYSISFFRSETNNFNKIRRS